MKKIKFIIPLIILFIAIGFATISYTLNLEGNASSALKEGSQITVNYTSETEALVDAMIATKTEGANVVKGTLVS